ncbi:glycosyltransferase [Vibrio cholerae]|nr:glycosyltransferase [Vibrio cholerae]EGR2244795.1 glycosyltransferase [Vibrio cholerae]
MLGLYCNWKVTPSGNGFYINAIHAKYLMMFNKKYGSLILMSNVTERSNNINSSDVYIEIDNNIKLIALPYFSSYIGAIRHFPKILKAMWVFFCECQLIYVRSPEPLSWLLGLFNFKKAKTINYHFTSNPLQVLLSSHSSNFLVKYLKVIIFFPEYLLICLAAKFNKCSANGESILPYLPFFIKKKDVIVHIESTLTKDELDINLCMDKHIFWDELETLNLICVSRLQQGKGIDILLKAIVNLKLNNPGLKFILNIVGDGPLYNHYESMILTLGVSDCVKLHGHVKNGPDLDKIYLESHVLINPSLSETGPRVLLEAMRLSVLCISTDVGYAKRLIQSGEENGIIIRPNSVDEIEKSIVWVSDNKCDAWIMASHSYEKSKLYSLDYFIDSIF